MNKIAPVPATYDPRWLNTVRDLLAYLRVGEGSPAGVVIANIGTLFLRTDGGASTTLYVKEADNGAATGWRAV